MRDDQNKKNKRPLSGTAIDTSAEVSVIVPACDAADTIQATIKSLVTERALIRELILVDDGSSDDTAAVAEAAAHDGGFSTIVLRTPNLGVGAARNLGARYARGALIYFIDADDTLVPGGVTTLVHALRNRPYAGAAYGAAINRRAGRKDSLIVPSPLSADGATNSIGLLRDRIRGVLTGSYILREHVVRSIMFHETMVYDEDICFWAQVFARTQVVTVDAPIFIYNASSRRAHDRLTTDARRRFLDCAVALRALADAGLDRDALRWRRARLALRVGSKLVRAGRHDEALRFLRIAMAHPELRDAHTARYLLQARVGRKFGRRAASSKPHAA